MEAVCSGKFVIFVKTNTTNKGSYRYRRHAAWARKVESHATRFTHAVFRQLPRPCALSSSVEVRCQGNLRDISVQSIMRSTDGQVTGIVEFRYLSIAIS